VKGNIRVRKVKGRRERSASLSFGESEADQVRAGFLLLLPLARRLQHNQGQLSFPYSPVRCNSIDEFCEPPFSTSYSAAPITTKHAKSSTAPRHQGTASKEPGRTRSRIRGIRAPREAERKIG